MNLVFGLWDVSGFKNFYGDVSAAAEFIREVFNEWTYILGSLVTVKFENMLSKYFYCISTAKDEELGN